MIKLDMKELAKTVIIAGAKSVAISAGITVLATIVVKGVAGVKSMTVKDLLDK